MLICRKMSKRIYLLEQLFEIKILLPKKKKKNCETNFVTFDVSN